MSRCRGAWACSWWRGWRPGTGSGSGSARAATGGLIALVWLPDEAILHESPDASPGVRRTGVPDEFLSEPGSLAGAGADGAGATSGIWGETTGSRTAAEQEVTAARAPRFAPLRRGRRRHRPRARPAAGAWGRAEARWRWANTGPLPMFRTVPRPAGADARARGHRRRSRRLAQTGTRPRSRRPLRRARTRRPRRSRPFGIGPQPVGRGGGRAARHRARSPFSARPPAGASADGDAPARSVALGWTARGLRLLARGVIVPSADSLGEEHRLPIFEAVESDWFRRGRQSVGRLRLGRR